MCQEKINLLTKRIEELERRLELIESKGEKNKRPHKWQSKIMDCINIINRPATKEEVLVKIVSTYPMNGLDINVIRRRVSSSYSKLVRDSKLIILKPNSKDFEIRVAMRAWFLSNDRNYAKTQKWFIENTEYDYLRI